MNSVAGVNVEKNHLDKNLLSQEKFNYVVEKEDNNQMKLVWFNIILMGLLYAGAVYGVYLIFSSAKIATIVFAFILHEMGILGITAGAHRLWTHQSYKAKWPLRLLVITMHSLTFQSSVLRWVREHRLHHKYSDTDADPHNSNRGFFFSHVGWLLVRKNNEVREKAKGIDVSDLFNDPIVKFQHKYFVLIVPFFTFGLPAVIPVYFWNETWSNAFFIASVFRFVVTFNISVLINSLAHFYGNKPYDRNIYPADNKTLSALTLGEGWHNYHHTFPWDYKTSELGNYSFNVTTAFIDFFAWIGWAYDLKTVSADMIKKRVQRTGDGSHEVWGWNDKDVTKEDQEATIITHKQM